MKWLTFAMALAATTLARANDTPRLATLLNRRRHRDDPTGRLPA